MTREPTSNSRRRRWAVVGLSLLGVVALLAAALFLPLASLTIASHPRPAADYAEAAARIGAWQAAETADYNPVCRAQFLTHGQKTERVIVFVHGYTNCPAQFAELGAQFFDLGYNVLIAPMPHHGLADRLTDEQAQLTADELATYADEVVDVAQGLGQHVTVAGISCGGVVTAWAAQQRNDVDLAVVISPAFGFQAIQKPLTVPIMNYSLLAPNSFTWWDAELKETAPPPQAYPRYATHALAQTLRLGFAVQVGAFWSAPQAGSFLVITNANDGSVDNTFAYDVEHRWQDYGVDVRTYEFPAELRLGHDLIDPTQPDQRTDLVYPQLISLITQ